MPWYVPWSESIKNRLSRYLLQRYLGQFLEEKLTLDQLTVDLYNGTGSVSDVRLDVQALNELGEQQNLPIEFVDGFISEVSVSIPWSSILRDGSYVEVSGLVITVQPKQRADTCTSMFESMWNSMTSSMQLAEECLKQGAAEDNADQSQPLEGLELFAQSIDSILSRVKVKFVNTTLRLEHVPKDSDSGVAIEFRIKNMDYLDEAGTDPPTPPSPADVQLQQGNKMYQIAAYTTKKLYMEGVTIYTDEYPTCARTFSRSVMSLSTSSTPDSKGSDSNFQSAPATPPSSPIGNNSNMAADQDPILIGRLAGRQEVSVKLRQTEGIIGPKVELEVNLGALTAFLSPRQLHVLVELVNGLASPDMEDTSNVLPKTRCTEKPMDPSDFHRVEQELQQQLNPDMATQSKNLQYAQGWSTASLDDSDEEFHPMRVVGIATMSDSVASSSSTMDTSVSSTASSKYGTPPPSRARRRKKSGVTPGASLDTDPTADVSRFHVRIASIAAVLLHEDVLTTVTGGAWLAHSSVQQMKRLAEDFFHTLGFVMPQRDLKQSDEAFDAACSRSHLRLVASPVVIAGDEKTSAHARAVSFTVSASRAELVECLPSETAATERVHLLRFDEQVATLPDIKVTVRMAERLSRGSRPHVDICVTLQPCRCEVDFSIVDRITALLNPAPLCHRSSSVGDSSPFDAFRAAAETSADVSYSLKLSSPSVQLDVRFPCPDLRPMHDMDRLPWWSRSVRKDVLTLKLEEATLVTELMERYEITCREVLGSFLKGDTETSVPFLHAGVDERAGAGSLVEGFGWPRMVVHVFPEETPTELEEEEGESGEESMRQTEPLEAAGRREPSPFSSKKVIHESDTPHGRNAEAAEELVIPGDRSEIAEFTEHAAANARVRLEISVPCATLHLSSKHLYELIYNRIGTDMMLWEPAAPKPTQESPYFPARDVAASLLQESLYPAFSMCKSGVQLESDSDSDSGEPVYYSVYEHKQRQRRRHQASHSPCSVQSKVAVTLVVGRGALSLYAPARDTAGVVIPGQHGEINIHLEEGNLFAVSGYQGNSGLGYVCVQVGLAQFFHGGLLGNRSEASPSMSDFHLLPSHLDNTIYRSERGAAVGSSDSGDMVTVAMKIHTDRVKTFRVAVALRGATLRHRAVVANASWFSQLVDMLDVMDYPVPGYDPPGVVTELHLHLWDCAVDYRPLYLPLKSMVTMGSFTVSSNIAAATSSSTLRFIAEDAALFISDKTKHRSAPVDLRKDYVCVVDLGLFELSLRLCDKTNGLNVSSPKVDLRASNNVLHVRTCSDSGRALTELLTYFAGDGDLTMDDHSNTTSSSVSTEPLLVDTGPLDSNQNPSNLSKSQTEHVHDLMEEAMKEMCGDKKLRSQKSTSRNGKGVEIFFFPDENHPLPSKPLELSECLDEDDDEDDWEDDFCMVDKEAGSGILLHNGFPEVRLLSEEPVRVIDNHFTLPMGKTDLLKAPKHYPNPVLRYTLREMTIVWHMFGGEDFALKPTKKQVSIDDRSQLSVDVSFNPSNPTEVRFKPAPPSPKINVPLSWQARGGPSRQHEVLMELQLNKIRFQHEVYPEHTLEASRQVLLISEVEVRDRLASSQINKFLYQHSTEARPKQSHANMVLIRAVHIRPDPKLRAQECSLKVSLLPLRLNIDQDSLLFLVGFFTEISDGMRDVDEGQGHATPTHRPPVMSVNVESTTPPVPEPQSLLILLEDDPPRPPTPRDCAEPPSAFPIFFRSFTFSPEVPVRLDYHGKHVDMTHGPLAGLLMGLGQLNCSELRLKRLNYRHGLLGFDKLLAFALSEWLNDIKKNQLPSLLGGVGPMHALVQLFQGIRDLFWLPIEQYQKDGRIVRGLQRGANSFTTSTAMAALELANRLVQAIQSTAEMAYDMLSPGPSVRRRSRKGNKKRRYRQPADIREGMANAYMLVRDGVSETAQTIVRVASEEHDQKGVSGAVGGVLRQIPPTVVKPIILATEATSNLLGGMRSQLVPDARKEAAEKWRCDE